MNTSFGCIIHQNIVILAEINVRSKCYRDVNYSSQKENIEGYKRGSCFHLSLGRTARNFWQYLYCTRVQTHTQILCTDTRPLCVPIFGISYKKRLNEFSNLINVFKASNPQAMFKIKSILN